MTLELRPQQVRSLDGLRAGFADGNRAQILYGPTGFGKTEIACAMMAAAADKGTRSAMVLDRIVLCDQTSRRLDKYKVPHGVLQSGHWRYRPEERIQVCSAQTLEKRGSFPGLQLLIVDECHNSRVFINEFIKANPQIKAVGLSATPFTKGLGSIYSHVVSATTTEELVGAGFLVPLRVFVCKPIDMTGAKKVAGEWSDKEATERGIKISGDVVSEWIAKTTQIFGGPRKTIVFCAGVAHGADLAKKFAESGHNFVSISYKDDDEFKRQAIEDFSKPDSSIIGLIATDILTKGFDVPDVRVGISARPFTKSLSSHIQQLGRVMRPSPGKEFALWLDHCIASGQRVLTRRGLVPIEQVLLSDTLWDGHEFVAHGGVVNRGIRPVITYCGLTGTPDHPVRTEKGWRTLGACAEEQAAIITTGVGRTALRQRDDHLTRGVLAGTKGAALHALHLRVRHLWVSLRDFALELGWRAHEGLSALQSAQGASAVVAGVSYASDAPAMPQQEHRRLQQLRRAGHRVQVRIADYLRSMDCAELGVAAERSFPGARQEEQRRALRAWQHTLGDETGQHGESTHDGLGSSDACVQAASPGGALRRLHAAIAHCRRAFGRGDRRSVASPVEKTERQVWDVLDCGPRNSFTCEGLLVHNSGNYIRFQDDWEAIYSEGPGDLDDGREKAKKEPGEKEIREAKCPSCGVVWPPNADFCPSCGHERKRRNDVVVLPGEMEELAKREKATRDAKQAFYSELLWVQRERGYKPGWLAHKYQAKFGVWPRGLNEHPARPSFATLKWLQSQAIRWAKSGRAA